jgi:hypothetical protein
MDNPKWATDLLKEIALKEGKYRKMPYLTFSLSKRHWNGQRIGWHGHFQPRGRGEIVIFAPYKMHKDSTFCFDQEKEMLLHEISHWLVPGKATIYFYGERRPKNEWHTKKFYRKLFRFCQQYEIPYADFKSEFTYMPRNSKKAYEQIYKKPWNEYNKIS